MAEPGPSRHRRSRRSRLRCVVQTKPPLFGTKGRWSVSDGSKNRAWPFLSLDPVIRILEPRHPDILADGSSPRMHRRSHRVWWRGAVVFGRRELPHGHGRRVDVCSVKPRLDRRQPQLSVSGPGCGNAFLRNAGVVVLHQARFAWFEDGVVCDRVPVVRHGVLLVEHALSAVRCAALRVQRACSAVLHGSVRIHNEVLVVRQQGSIVQHGALLVLQRVCIVQHASVLVRQPVLRARSGNRKPRFRTCRLRTFFFRVRHFGSRDHNGCLRPRDLRPCPIDRRRG